MFDATLDAKVRAAAFAWLDEHVAMHGEVLTKDTLVAGFPFSGRQIPLVDNRRGIWKPGLLSEVPLSFLTTFNSPYSDRYENGILLYSYQGEDPNGHDNILMRNAMQRRTPLIYFGPVGRGRYLAVKPAYVIGDNPVNLTFSVQIDSADLAVSHADTVREGEDARRAYVTSLTRVRLHQKAFRERVLDAYRRQCAFCRLRHDELLEAAHIIPDSEPEGEPKIANGISLCNLHHAAFDRFFVALRPDYSIEVRSDILAEKDGPTLKHAIQGLHGTRILLPTKAVHRPDPALVKQRYERFVDARK
jgi:putative restriction endonuclease